MRRLFGFLILAAAFLTLCGLGTWQLQRQSWKENILTQLAQSYEQPPAVIDSALLDGAEENKTPFLRGTAHGVYLNNKEMRIGPRTQDGVTGYHVVTPLQLDDGTALLVNRGWIAQDSAAPPPPESPATVTGLLRRPDPPSSFTPPNAPDKGQWFSIDPAQAGFYFKFGKITPYVLYAEGASAEAVPTPLPRWQPPNNHRQYAITWFALAAALLAIIFLKRRKI